MLHCQNEGQIGQLVHRNGNYFVGIDDINTEYFEDTVKNTVCERIVTGEGELHVFGVPPRSPKEPFKLSSWINTFQNSC